MTMEGLNTYEMSQVSSEWTKAVIVEGIFEDFWSLGESVRDKKWRTWTGLGDGTAFLHPKTCSYWCVRKQQLVAGAACWGVI